MNNSNKKSAVDLYSGIGGWTLGLKLAGIPVISSYEWWKDANRTHNKNFNSDHNEIDIRSLALSDLPSPGMVNYVVGSPPCTQFSLANRGGKGDIADGLVDIYKFLEVVEYLQPKYWAMENVPRVANILEEQLKKGPLKRFAELFDDIRILKASDFGVPQDRKRMIAGRLPFDLLDSYKQCTPTITLGDVVKALETDPAIDPVYGIRLGQDELTDHILESSLNQEERRINQETKSHHPVYNMMSFPDRLDRPSRTVTAVCTRVSRESIVIEDGYGNLRRLTVRERGLLQSFPINYQYFGSSYNNKIKMIGNAVPPVLTFYIAQAMKEVSLKNVKLPSQVSDRIVLGSERAISSTPDSQGTKYPWSRSFRMAISGLRFGSGVRFELKNEIDKLNKKVEWQIGFHYGNSKNMKEKFLDFDLFNRAVIIAKRIESNSILESLIQFDTFLWSLKVNALQDQWSNRQQHAIGPIEVVDRIAAYAQEMKNQVYSDESQFQVISFIESELKNDSGGMDNKKILEKPQDIFIGILLGSLFNSVMSGKKIKFALSAKAVSLSTT